MESRDSSLEFLGNPDRVITDHPIPIKKSPANWVALMPYSYIKSAQNPIV